MEVGGGASISEAWGEAAPEGGNRNNTKILFPYTDLYQYLVLEYSARRMPRIPCPLASTLWAYLVRVSLETITGAIVNRTKYC